MYLSCAFFLLFFHCVFAEWTLPLFLKIPTSPPPSPKQKVHTTISLRGVTPTVLCPAHTITMWCNIDCTTPPQLCSPNESRTPPSTRSPFGFSWLALSSAGRPAGVRGVCQGCGRREATAPVIDFVAGNDFFKKKKKLKMVVLFISAPLSLLDSTVTLMLLTLETNVFFFFLYCYCYDYHHYYCNCNFYYYYRHETLRCPGFGPAFRFKQCLSPSRPFASEFVTAWRPRECSTRAWREPCTGEPYLRGDVHQVVLGVFRAPQGGKADVTVRPHSSHTCVVGPGCM